MTDHYELGDIQRAEENAFYVLQQEDSHAHPYGLYTLALVRRQQEQIGHARNSLMQAKKLVEENGDTYLLAYVQRLLGEILVVENQTEEGQKLLQEALALFTKLGIKNEAIQTEKLLSSTKQ